MSRTLYSQLDPLLAKCVGMTFGWVNVVRSVNLHPAPIFVHSATSNHPEAIGGHSLEPTGGYGLELTEDRSFEVAIAECIERHGATGYPWQSKVVEGTYRELKEKLPLLSLEDMQIFRSEQLQGDHIDFRDLREDDVASFVEGQLMDGDKTRPIYYPLDRVRMGGAQSFFLGRSNTSGFALGPNAAWAQASAMAEIIERDAIMTAWWLKRAPKYYRFADLVSLLPQETLRLLEWVREKVYVLDLSEEWNVPTFCVVILGQVEKGEPAVTMGGSCNIDGVKALERASREALGIFVSFRAKEKVQIPEPPYDKSINHILDAVKLFQSSKGLELFAEFMTGRHAGKEELAQSLALRAHKDLFSAAAAKGARVITLDLTPIDLELAGLKLIRVVIPEAIPLNTTHSTRAWGCPKLRQFSIAELNPIPHPFP